MAFPGVEPREQSRYRASNTTGWTDVPNVPFTSLTPVLPTKKGHKWYPEVQAWWKIVRRMPHCVLWTETDWQFALETAFLKQDWWSDYYSGTVYTTKSVEVRRREDQMGTTVEARRKLRIRYTDVEAASEQSTDGTVASLDDRRRRLTGA